MRELQTEAVNLDQVVALTLAQVKARYNLGNNGVVEVAEQAGAIIRIGPRKRLYSRAKLDKYFEEELTECY